MALKFWAISVEAPVHFCKIIIIIARIKIKAVCENVTLAIIVKIFFLEIFPLLET